MNDIPEGYRKLNAAAVYTNGEMLIVLGHPSDIEDESEETGHNCDQMGCGSFGPHVIAYGRFLFGDAGRKP